MSTGYTQLRSGNTSCVSFRPKSNLKSSNQSNLRQRANIPNSILNFEQDAFMHSDVDENEDVDIDLQRVVSEEAIIFEIFEAVKRKHAYQKIIKSWWDTASNYLS